MKLIVCWGTFDHPGEHPCRTAHVALKEAGYEPEVVKAYGSMMLPDAISTGRLGGARPSDSPARRRFRCS